MRIRLKHEVLAQQIAASAISQNRWAIRIGLSTGHLSELVNGRKVYPSALTREKLLEGTGLVFSDLFQVEHDREHDPEQVEDRGTFPQAPLLDLSWAGFRIRLERSGASRRGRSDSMASIIQDFRYGWRAMRRAPLVSLLSILTIGLSIGGNAAIFSLVNTVLFRPLDFEQPGSLVLISGTAQSNPDRYRNLSHPDFQDLRSRSRLFAGFAAFRDNGYDVRLGESTHRVEGARVSSTFFSLLRVRPLQGRFFGTEGDQVTAPRVAVVSEAFWRSSLGAAPDSIGKTLTIDRESYQLIGILPGDFRFPVELARAEVWTPLGLDGELLENRGTRYLRVLGRLRQDVSPGAARQEVAALGEALAREFPENRERGLHLIQLHEYLVGSSRAGLLLLLGAVGAVLLIACANVASLTLARGSTRRTEMAMRNALGATRSRLIRQLVTESLITALAGGVLGLLLARICIGPMVGLLPPEFPRIEEIAVDGPVFGFSLLVSLLAVLVFGVIPALQDSKISPVMVLKSGGRSILGGSSHWIRSGLVLGEVALTLLLLVGSGLMIRSFIQLVSVDPGFEPGQILTFRVARPFAEDTVGDSRLAYYRAVLEALTSIPGVEVAGATTSLPFSSTRINVGITRLGDPEAEEESIRYSAVSSGYFQAMGIPLLQGRHLEEQDLRGKPGAVLVDRALAERFWPQESALGKSLSVDVSFGQPGEPVEYEVVGVVENHRTDSFDSPVDSNVFLPYGQQTWPFMSFVVRTSGDPESLMVTVQKVVSRIDADQSLTRLEPMQALVDRSVTRQRLALVLVSAFSGLALVLAFVGLYGVVAYQVARRIPEFGIRMALGARRGEILRLVIGRGLRLTLSGLALGLIAAFALSGLLSRFLFQLSATDPLTYGLVSALVLVVALLACWAPAWRATRVDPGRTLHSV